MNTDTMSMASLRLAAKRGHLSDDDLRRMEDERAQEQSEIRAQVHNWQGPPKMWSHPQSHRLERYWGAY